MELVEVLVIELVFALAAPGGNALTPEHWTHTTGVVETRLSLMGVEKSAVSRSADRLVVRLPADVWRREGGQSGLVVRYLTHAGTLAFRPVATPEAAEREATRRRAEGASYKPSPGLSWVQVAGGPVNGQKDSRPVRELLIETGRGFDRTVLKSVRRSLPGESLQEHVVFAIDPAQVEAWRAFTRSLIGRRFAILVGDEVASALTVQSQIGEAGQITGLSEREIRDLVRWMKAPPLSVALTLESKSSIKQKP